MIKWIIAATIAGVVAATAQELQTFAHVDTDKASTYGVGSTQCLSLNLRAEGEHLFGGLFTADDPVSARARERGLDWIEGYVTAATRWRPTDPKRLVRASTSEAVEAFAVDWCRQHRDATLIEAGDAVTNALVQ